MHTAWSRIGAGALALATTLSPAGAADAVDLAASRKTTLPLVDAAPAIDGKLDDPGWQKASRLTNFLDMKRVKRTVSEQTEVRLMRDGENLYFGFVCDSFAPSKIQAATPREQRDNPRLYKDDSINIFIDTEHSRNDCYQWIVNVNGAVFDQVLHRLIYTERMLPSLEWNSRAEAAGSRDGTHWTLEVKIPLSDFTPRDLKALAENKTWGIQFGRENWTLPDGGTEDSTWSATYSFAEPESFGTTAFAGAAVAEERQVWIQAVDPGMALMDPPRRPAYTFARCFDFGPPPDEEERAADDPKGVLFVDPDTAFSTARGYGFENAAGLAAVRSGDRKFSEGGRLSPLSSDYIKSTNTATFRFALPAGKYQAALLGGKNFFLGDVGGMDFTVEVNGSRRAYYQQEAGRLFLPLWVDFETDGRAPVTVRLVPAPGTSWAAAALLVSPQAESAEAREAFYWVERDAYNYPFEKYVNRTEAWIDIPAGNIDPAVTDAERKRGLALFGLSPTAFVPASYIPEKSDPRDKASTLAAPGVTAALMVGVHALRPFKNLHAAIGSAPGDGIRVQLLQGMDMLVNVGKLSMNQMGRFPKLLGRPEPVRLEPGRTQAYFLSADIAADAAPGVRRGTLDVFDGDRKVADLPFEFIVLPFVPSNRNATIRSIFYNPPICGNFAKDKIGRELEDIVAKTRHQLLDLKRHGINAVHVYADSTSYTKEADGLWHFRPRDNERIFWNLLREFGIREHAVTVPILEGLGAAMINDYLERAGHPERVTSMTTRYVCKDKLPPAFFENVALLVRENLEARAKLGFSLPAFDPWDEPGHLNSEAYVPILKAIRAGGGQTCVQTIAACYPTLSGLVDVKTYDMGSLTINGGEAESPEQVAEIKAREGSTYTVYPNSTIMGGDPRASRQMFGYFTWAWNLDGADPYKYWKILGDYRISAGFQQGSFHPMMFDAGGGIIFSTPSWENFAEGAFDNDLLQELAFRIAHPAPEADRQAVADAAAFLEQLRRLATFHPTFIARGHDSQTAAPKFTRFNWHPARFDHLRAAMALHLMRLTSADRKHPELTQAVTEAERSLRTREEALRTVQNRGAPLAREGNLIANGTFEDSAVEAQGGGWRSLPGFTNVSPNAYVQSRVRRSGEKALAFKHRQAMPWDNVRTGMIPLVPGKTYTFTGWAKRDAPAKGDTALWTGFQIKTYQELPVEGRQNTTDPFVQRVGIWFPQDQPTFDWLPFRYPFTPGESERYIVFTLYNNDNQGDIFWDDLELLEFDNQ
jgi:hypothetical protein